MQQKKTTRAKKAPGKKPVGGRAARKPRTVKSKPRSAARPRKAKPRSAAARGRSSGIVERAKHGYWAAGAVAAVLLAGFGLWSLQRPLDTPPPVLQEATAAGAPPAPVAEAPAAPPVPEPSRAPAQDSPPRQALAPVQEKPRARAAIQSGPFAEEFSKAETLDLAGRIGYWSKIFWRDPGINAKLAGIPEAPSISDSAPLVPGKFDCTTFVETIAALARSRSSSDFFRNLIAIRYENGQADFLHRNHFPEADWIPNNEKAGILSDITKSVAREARIEPGIATKRIDRAAWLERQIAAGKADRSIAAARDPKWTEPKLASVAYIPIGEIDKVIDGIPDGAIVNIVLKDGRERPCLISHQGFVVREGGVTLLRHSSVSGRIRTIGLAEYLRKAAASQPSLIGINLNRLDG